MADLGRKLTSLLLVLTILLAFVVVPGCKKKEEPTTQPDTKQVEEKQKEAEKAVKDMQ